MGTMSANKSGGLALMLAPVVTLILYFLQPGGTFIDPVDPSNGPAAIEAMISNAGLGKVVWVLIPIGLLWFLYGTLVLQSSIRANGNGDALSRMGVLFLLAGVIGWVIASGISLTITSSGLPIDQAFAVHGSLYAANIGISTVASIIAGLGFLYLALAVSTREDYNKELAIVAAIGAAVAIIAAVLGGMNPSQLQAMNLVTGVTYLIHMVWLFTVGQKLAKGE